MARKSLRPQLNTIRTWVRQGRTDAWIAHQLEVDTAQLREFKRQHDLVPGEEGNGDEGIDLRDEIEAEVEAAQEAATEEEEARGADATGEEEAGEEEAGEEEAGERPRRRRRRGGRRRGGRKAGAGPYEGTFDHGEREGYGLWLDPAVQDDPVYVEHWAGHRPLKVTLAAERIVIERAGEEPEK